MVIKKKVIKKLVLDALDKHYSHESVATSAGVFLAPYGYFERTIIQMGSSWGATRLVAFCTLWALERDYARVFALMEPSGLTIAPEACRSGDWDTLDPGVPQQVEAWVRDAAVPFLGQITDERAFATHCLSVPRSLDYPRLYDALALGIQTKDRTLCSIAIRLATGLDLGRPTYWHSQFEELYEIYNTCPERAREHLRALACYRIDKFGMRKQYEWLCRS